MEVSFLVVFLAAFLAYFDSVKVCADREEVPTANWKRWIPVEGSQRAVNVICADGYKRLCNQCNQFITLAPVYINDFRGVRERYVKCTG